MSFSPLVNSLVKNRLFKTAPDIDEPPFQFIHTVDSSVVDTMLHDSPDLVIHRTEIWAVWRPRVGHIQASLAFLDAAVQLFKQCTGTPRCAVCRCTVLLELEHRHSAYRWQQHDVTVTSCSSSKEISKRYHQNFLFCNNNAITARAADLFNRFFFAKVSMQLHFSR